MIDCIKNKNVKINDYCETCKILVNFTTELYEKMLDDLENAELIKVVHARQCQLDMKSTVEVNIAYL